MANGTKPPYQIRDESLSVLRQAIKKLKSPECMLEVHNATDEVKAQWAQTLLASDKARDELEKRELSEIRDKLKQQEKELSEGVASVNRALENLKDIKLVLDAVAAFVTIIAQILTTAR